MAELLVQRTVVSSVVSHANVCGFTLAIPSVVFVEQRAQFAVLVLARRVGLVVLVVHAHCAVEEIEEAGLNVVENGK